jgi:hypothetical protein
MLVNQEWFRPFHLRNAAFQTAQQTEFHFQEISSRFSALFSASLGAIIDQNSQGLLVRRSSEFRKLSGIRTSWTLPMERAIDFNACAGCVSNV